MATRFSAINVEQSIARYLADNFQDLGYAIRWWNTRKTEGTGNTVTFIRKFPNVSTDFVNQASNKTSPTLIKVPAFTVFANSPRTSGEDRLGIGERLFDWTTQVRIDGFADNELEWYQFHGWFADWMGDPDVEVTLYDFESDLENDNPAPLDATLSFENVDVLRDEIFEQPAVRYYISVSFTAKYIA
jgi:hypothetical protein